MVLYLNNNSQRTSHPMTFMTLAEYRTTHIKDRESQINKGGCVICLDTYLYLIVGSCLAYN